MFIRSLCFSKSLSSISKTPDNAKCIFLNNQQCITQPALINLYPNEYIEILHWYPFEVNLDRWIGNFNTLYDLSNQVNKTEDLDLSIFNMITGIN